MDVEFGECIWAAQDQKNYVTRMVWQRVGWLVSFSASSALPDPDAFSFHGSCRAGGQWLHSLWMLPSNGSSHSFGTAISA